MIGFGLLTGTLVAVAVSFGREETSSEVAIRLGARFPMPWVSASWPRIVSGFTVGFLTVLGQPPEFAAAVGRVTLILGWSLPAQLLFIATSFFLEAIGRPHPGMIAIGLGAAVNGLLCWALVFGHGGLPALGAEGTAIANLIVRVLLAAGLIVYALSFRDAARFGTRRSGTGGWQSGASQRRIGYADGLSLGIKIQLPSTAMNLFGGEPRHGGGRRLCNRAQPAQRHLHLCPRHQRRDRRPGRPRLWPAERARRRVLRLAGDRRE